jgi:hypothetical protein
MGNDHAPGKIMVDSKNKIDIFEDCIHAYSDKTGSHRQFPLNRIILLYAITIYLQHQTEITKDDFVRRIRIVDNLIQNSVDEISDRSDRNRLPAILQAVDAIILTGQIDDNIKNSFNVNQLNEEKDKITFIENHPELAEELFALEDHELLRGQVGIIGVDNLKFRSRFTSLFSCSMDKIECALMSIGDYGQKEGTSYRYQYGAKNASAWTKLFHKSANHNFDETKTVLKKLLDTNSEFSNDILTGITDAFIAECEAKSTYPWRYYYVKYPVFRQSYYGKLYKETAAKPYVVSVMQTERHLSQNTYSPYLKEAETANPSKARISRDHLGQRLDVGGSYITVDNDVFIIHSSDGAVLNTLPVIQSDDGIDIEDRIMKLKNYISSNY